MSLGSSGNVAIIDTGGANLGSVRQALERLGASPHIARDADDLMGARCAILPGVGAARTAMQSLRERGFDQALQTLEAPLLGICLGMQLLFDSSEEGDVPCLGLLGGAVRRLHPEIGIHVPHMGWNQLQAHCNAPLLEGIPDDAQVYYVHSFAAPVTDDCIATCTHGARFAAAVQRGHRVGVQFHPERSGAVGARLLANFLAIRST